MANRVIIRDGERENGLSPNLVHQQSSSPTIYPPNKPKSSAVSHRANVS